MGASVSCLFVLVPGHTKSGDLVPTNRALEASGGQFLSLFSCSSCTCYGKL